MLETVDFTCRYSQNALGSEDIRPISGTPYQYWGGLGMMVVESTDTLWIMKLEKEYQQALAWIQAELRFDLNHFTSVFETIIRMVGGLLSGYALTQDPVYLQKAEDLADRLMASYEGLLNHPNVNLATGAGSQVEKKSSLAEIAHELCGVYVYNDNDCCSRYLSQITGNPKYREKAESIIEFLDGVNQEERSLTT